MTESNQSQNPQDLLSKLAEVEREVVQCAREVVESASDPLSGVINFCISGQKTKSWKALL